MRRLSRETPAIYILFDCLMDADGTSLVDAPLSRRREALEAFSALPVLRPAFACRRSPQDPAEARRWLERTGAPSTAWWPSGADGPYAPGERARLKVKRLRTADCVVGGFRYQAGSREVGSLLLGLYDNEGRLKPCRLHRHYLGRRTPALTERLEALREPPGFTGDAPGGPSRWSTERSGQWEPLRPELVVEVRYDQVTGGRFRHGTRLVRWRPDKAPRQCGCEQLQSEARVGEVMAAIG